MTPNGPPRPVEMYVEVLNEIIARTRTIARQDLAARAGVDEQTAALMLGNCPHCGALGHRGGVG